MPTVHFYLQKTSTPELGLIYLQAKHNGERFFFSFNTKVDKRYWDVSTERIINCSETRETGIVFINVFLDKLSDYFIKVFNYLLATGRLKFNEVTRMLKVFVEDNKAGKTKLRARKDVDTLNMSYVKKVLKKNGFSDMMISENPDLAELKILQIKINRYVKEKTRKESSGT